MNTDEREVLFHFYCKKCEYEKLYENEQPCDECLANPTNLYTDKPVCFKEVD